MKAIILLVILSVICLLLYIFKTVLEFLYIIVRYGYSNHYAYLDANIRKFRICQYTAERNDRIKFHDPYEGDYIEGVIIGLTKDNKLYVLDEKSGFVTWYLKSEITDDDIIYLK